MGEWSYKALGPLFKYADNEFSLKLVKLKVCCLDKLNSMKPLSFFIFWVPCGSHVVGGIGECCDSDNGIWSNQG